jgi:hypothetical protein
MTRPFLTFFALLKIFSASEQLFHAGWFVESLATQTPVIFIIRTAGNPFRSRPQSGFNRHYHRTSPDRHRDPVYFIRKDSWVRARDSFTARASFRSPFQI